MKKLFLLSLLLCLLVFAGCNNKTKPVPETREIQETEIPDTTIYGKCGEGTAMHTLELITDKGDTIIYSLEDADTEADVQGGLFSGDRLAIVACKGLDGGMFAKKVINLTSLIGKWGSLDKSFEICEGGFVESNVTEPKPYTEWKILNGMLVLSADTFNIYNLGPDSLLLENSQGIYGYKRFSKEADNK